MAAKRTGSPVEEGSSATNKKPKLQIQPIRSFCSISDITPQTATLPTPANDATTLAPPATNPESNLNVRVTGSSSRTFSDVWVVLEQWHPKEPTPDQRAMIQILGIFNNATAALEHAEEHTRALYTVTNHGIRSPPTEEDDRASEDMDPTDVYERRLEYFRDQWEREEEEDLEDGLKKWTIHWGDVTEVWIEKQQLCETKEQAGYFTPLPVSDEVEGKEW